MPVYLVINVEGIEASIASSPAISQGQATLEEAQGGQGWQGGLATPDDSIAINVSLPDGFWIKAPDDLVFCNDW